MTIIFKVKRMPQSLNRKAFMTTNNIPFGKGSLSSTILDTVLRHKQHIDKINERENKRLENLMKLFDQKKQTLNYQTERMIRGINKDIKELEAYQKVLESYKADKMKTLEFGFDRSKYPKTPKSQRRLKFETRIYHAGPSLKVLYPEVLECIERENPVHKRQRKAHALYERAKVISDFQIDRRITNEALRKETKQSEKPVRPWSHVE
ncbi:unnamed protein product [Owenia fusiformis]|uniref:Uncharacterized protein n=1 Tax=Owenia fusiformis TaxID=6347 RepID=A0A8J1TDW3_OWEFU|nr:unnamed protein product [Owenia fusiformis]